MSKKKHVSVRFKDTLSDGRITFPEWEEFKGLANYFDISDDLLVEAALKYYYCPQKPNNVPQQTDKNNELLAELLGRYPSLNCLLPSLANGRLDNKVTICREKNHFIVPAGTEVYYYPPYLISFEVFYQIRITLDLTEPFSIKQNGSNIVIEV